MDQVVIKKLEEFVILEHENSDRNRILNFMKIVDETKSKKKLSQALGNMKDVKDGEWDCYIQTKLLEKGLQFLNKVSTLLEISPYTCGIMERNYEIVVCYVNNILQQICEEEITPTQLTDSTTFSTISALAAKVCLQMVQFIPKKTEAVLFGALIDHDIRDSFHTIIQLLMTMICKKGFPKDTNLLSGTTLALIFNLNKTSDSVQAADEVVKFINMLAFNNESKRECSIFKKTFKLPKITCFLSQISLINGLITIGSKLLLYYDSKGELVLKTLFDVILNSCLKVPDANAKYMCFKTIFNLVNFLSTNNRLEMILKTCKNQEFFMHADSQFMQPLLAIVKNHIEDLVDGVSHFTQKIFRVLLQLQKSEYEIYPKEQHSPGKFIHELAGLINQQGWFMKGRWMLFSELIPHLGVDALLTDNQEIVNNLLKCLTTCSLPAISNEVYITALKEFKKVKTDTRTPTDLWSSMFLGPIITALTSDLLILRQNIGQYWLPSTFRIIPECFEILESSLTDKIKNNKHFLHSQIVIIKAAWDIGLLSSEELQKRGNVLQKGSQCIDLDVRIETFNVICSNTKKTEPLPTFLQQMILHYIRSNLNCDSSKFRQQMFSALKRLLLNVRDSSIMLYRHILKPGKGKTADTVMVEKLQCLIDFIEEIFKISQSCLSPASSYQRKKTGLQLVDLLSDLFVYVKDIKKRKKGAATESFLHMLEYVQLSSKENPKWKIISTTDTELLSCVEDQHDEIRELAVKILLYQQSVLSNEQELLNVYEAFSKIMTITLNLLNSPRSHEVESGGCYIYFMANRLTANPRLTNHLKQYFGIDEDSEGCCGLGVLLNVLIKNAEIVLSQAYSDFLLASTKRPIYGYSIAISQVLCHISESPTILPNDFNRILQRLLKFSNSLTSVMIKLLAGTFVAGVNDDTTQQQTAKIVGPSADSSAVNDTTQTVKVSRSSEATSPSFADIDEALDVTLKSSPSYLAFCESISHLHCRELLLSFCWLNLKSVSLIIMELGNAFYALKRSEHLTLDSASMEIIQAFFQLTLVRCRHKGVIETSYTSLSKFARSVSHVPKLWKIVQEWCSSVLSPSTDLKKHSSVTMRSAGIPMFVQSILSAEPTTENHELLHSTMKHLFNVASTKLDAITYDLPQFNAINILRSVFRDTSLSNAVLRYVEEAVILTMDGFSSPSWSVRNASTQLLGTLVPRMLGQRLSQEEVSQQNMSTVDVFFYRYPKLLPFLEECLRQQENMPKSSSLISPRLIPALTFLSKLRPSDSEDIKRISDRYLPHLHKLKHSAVFNIRDLTASAILAFTPVSSHHQIIEKYFQDFSTIKSSNSLHCSTLIILKLLASSHYEQGQKEHSHHIVKNLHKENVLERISSNIDYVTRSLVTDILSKTFTLLKDECSESCLHEYILNGLKCLRKDSERCGNVGKPLFEKALSKAVTTLLRGGTSDTKRKQVLAEFSEWPTKDYIIYKDFMEYFFQEIHLWLKDCTSGIKSTEFLETLIARSINNIHSTNRMSSNLLKCYLHVLEESNDSHCDIDIHFLVSLLRKERFPSILLPCISKALSRAIQKNDGLNKVITEEEVEIISEVFLRYSAPENDENLRFVVAQSLTILQDFLRCKSKMEKVLHRLFWASLSLLQDEDDEVRTEATRSLQFIAKDSQQTTTTPIQCNIVLQNFFQIHTLFDGQSVVFLRWLVDVCKEDSVVVLDADRDLMLFEQEAANLFAEESVVTDLVTKSLISTLRSITSRWQEYYGDITDFDELLEETHSAILETAKMIYDSLKQQMEGTMIRTHQFYRSVLGLFRNRKNFNPLYKLVKLLHVLTQRKYKLSTLKKDFDDINKWTHMNHPQLSEDIQEMKQCF